MKNKKKTIQILKTGEIRPAKDLIVLLGSFCKQENNQDLSHKQTKHRH